jgi:gelsolin
MAKRRTRRGWDLHKKSGGEAGKKYDGDGIPIEDTNMAGVGGEEDMANRKKAAAGEPAWEGIGTEPGIWIFRIESFKVVPWPKEKYGKFHEGDSYILLQTEFDVEEETGEPSDKLQHDIHFWLGKKTSTDEKGTAAYKTVELDDFFDGAAVQHREVQGHESEVFLSYFPDGVSYLPGGVDSGFKVTQSDIFINKLYQVRRNKGKIIVEEEQVALASLNHRDSFILQVERTIYVWDGDSASAFVKHAANTKAEKMESESNGELTVERNLDDTFWKALGGKGDICAADQVGEEVAADFGEGILYEIQVSDDDDRKLTVTEKARGELDRSHLVTTAVMMVDTRHEIFLWLGKETTKLEKATAFHTASDYLKMNKRDIDSTAITILKEGHARKNKAWLKMFPLEK